MRAQKHLVLPEEDSAEFADLEAAMVEELAPVGSLQAVLARRVAVAAWRLARADRIEVELFEERRAPTGGLGLALIRDGNGTRSFETLLRYRGAAMAEFWRALRTLKALQAEQAAQAEQVAVCGRTLARQPARRAALPLTQHAEPNEPESRMGSSSERRAEYALPHRPRSGGTLHEPAATWTPNEPGARRNAASPAAPERASPVSHDQPAAGRATAGVLTPMGGRQRRAADRAGQVIADDGRGAPLEGK
jgi:hypothetical protein